MCHRGIQHIRNLLSVRWDGCSCNGHELHRVFSSQDDEGRCYSDSFGELPELIERARADDDEQPSE